MEEHCQLLPNFVRKHVTYSTDYTFVYHRTILLLWLLMLSWIHEMYDNSLLICYQCIMSYELWLVYSVIWFNVVYYFIRYDHLFFFVKIIHITIVSQYENCEIQKPSIYTLKLTHTTQISNYYTIFKNWSKYGVAAKACAVRLWLFTLSCMIPLWCIFIMVTNALIHN